MSNNYNITSKPNKRDVDSFQDTSTNNENEENDFDHSRSINSDDIQQNDHKDDDEPSSSSYYSDDDSSKDKSYDIKSYTWNPNNPEWVKSAEELRDIRIYVHIDILEWILEYLEQHVFCEHLRPTVEEVYHHNLDGQIYLIKFYVEPYYTNPIGKTSIRIALGTIKNKLKYKRIWENRPSYFLKCDSNFADKKNRLVEELREFNLHESFTARSSDVNWFCIPKIEIYDFPEYLTDAKIKQIDLVFEKLSYLMPTLYICKQFKWHIDKIAGNYVEVKKLVMDVCAEKSIQCGWFEKCGIQEILDLDLAFKDYRNLYFNQNIEKDLDKLLKRKLPELASDNDEKLIFDFDTLPSYARQYFASKYYNKNKSFRNGYDDYLSKKYNKKEINLTGDKPAVDELLNEDHPNIVYNISNYYNFSEELFRALLNKRNTRQTFKISFDESFNFARPEIIDKPSALFNLKTLRIELFNCIETNAIKLENFMKYLIDLFTKMPKSEAKIKIKISNCKLDNYSFFLNIGNSINQITFMNMKFPSSQFKILSRSLSQLAEVTFNDCDGITDNNVMTLLEHIDFENLWIYGKNACTLAVLFRIADRVMNTTSVNTPVNMRQFSKLREMSGITRYIHNLNDNYEFAKVDDKIVIREVKSKIFFDFYDYDGHVVNLVELQQIPPQYQIPDDMWL